MKQDRIKCLVTIVDREVGDTAAELYRTAGAPIHLAFLGRGTANSEMLDYLGLGETEKDVLVSLVTASAAPVLVNMAIRKLQLEKPGKGIIFTLGLAAVSGLVSKLLNQETAVAAKEQEGDGMEQQGTYELIVAAVDHGGTDTVMEAAKAAGATGGTILHARQLAWEGRDTSEAIHPEKEVVTILVPRSIRQAVMESVSRAAGITTERHGILFALPVDDIAGLRAT